MYTGQEILSREEELEQFRLMTEGSMEARDRLIESGIRWAVEIAKQEVRRFGLGKLSMDDVIQVAIIGLIKAIDGKFDPAKGRLTTYSRLRISGLVKHFLTNQRHTINVTAYAVKNKKKWSAETQNIIGGSVHELPEKFDTPGRCEEPSEGIENQELLDKLRKSIITMPYKLKYVIESRLAGKTLKSIGEELDISRERVRQLEVQAHDYLRCKLDH